MTWNDMILLQEVKWTQEEQVEMILDVLDEELPVEPYISPSEQDIIAQRLAEEERQRLLAVEVSNSLSRRSNHPPFTYYVCSRLYYLEQKALGFDISAHGCSYHSS